MGIFNKKKNRKVKETEKYYFKNDDDVRRFFELIDSYNCNYHSKVARFNVWKHIRDSIPELKDKQHLRFNDDSAMNPYIFVRTAKDK